MISSYKEKKLVEYLKPGQKVLIRFGHGLGDTLLFIPILEKLRALYPETQIDLYVESGQEKIFKSVEDKEGSEYDYVFHLDFPMSEGSNQTKPEKCCIDEIGIEPITDVAKLKSYPSPLVSVHFQGTALPNSVNCPENIAEQIWKEIKEAGKIPIEVHFEHCWHNPINKKFSFIDSSVRGSKPEISSLVGLIQHSFAFIGVASGPFVIALSVMPERLLFLEKYHKLISYTKRPVSKIELDNFKPGSVKKWLLSLDKNYGTYKKE